MSSRKNFTSSEGVGRIRVGEETLTVPRYGGVLIGPQQLRQVFNDTPMRSLCGSSSEHRNGVSSRRAA
ncbi:MAG: hypothetical protein R3F31_20035 [Verrucomicrobiales bacterium]